MATRTTTIRLVADVADFIRQMGRARGAADDLGTGAGDGAGRAATAFGRLGEYAQANEEHLQRVGGALTGIGAAAAVGVGAAVKAYADYDAQMSKVAAATGATGSTLERLGEAAVKAGADTQFSATEAAQGVTELAKAGVEAEDILGGGLTGALALAAAGELEVGEAAEIAATAMTQFRLGGDQVSHVADLLAGAANQAQGEVSDMALALDYAGLPAANLRVSIEETAGTIGLLASNGIIGERAGTGLRGMLVSLINPSGKAREKMDELGLSFFDASGQFVGMQGVADELQTGLAGLTDEQEKQALATIFGTESLNTALAVYSQTTGTVTEWTDKVDQSGYAAETAAAKMDNLKGDLEGLRGSLETALIGTGEGADGPLRALVQGLDDIVDGYNDLGDGAKGAALTVGGVTAAVGLGAGAFLTLAPGLFQTIDSFKELRRTSPGVASGLGRVGKAAGVAAVAFTALSVLDSFVPDLSDDIGGLEEATRALNDSADGSTAALDEFLTLGEQGSGPLESLRAGIGGVDDAAETLAANGAAKAFERGFGDALPFVQSQVGLTEEAIAELDASLAAMVTNGASEQAAGAVDYLRERFMAAGMSAEEAAAYFPEYDDAVIGLEESQAAAAEAATGLGTGIAEVGAAATSSAPGVEQFFTGWEGWAGTGERSAEEIDAMRESITDLSEAMGSFVDPLGTYTGLLDEKRAAEEEAARAAAVANGDTSAAWEQMVGDVDVSLEEYLSRLEEQVVAQDEWRANLTRLTGRMSEDSLRILAEMGPEGAALVADLVDASDTEIARFEAVMEEGSQAGTDAFAEQVIFGQPIIAEVAREFGAGAAREAAESWAAGETTYGDIARRYGLSIDGQAGLLEQIGAEFGAGARDEAVAKFNAGTGSMEEIARDYGGKVAAGLNPILKGLGKGPISLDYKGGTAREFFSTNADGNLYEDHQAEIAAGGSWRVWAEPETQGEAYIPLAASKRSRSLSIWRETGRRLGVGSAALSDGAEPAEVEVFADGGFMGASDVPKAPAVPGAFPIQTPAKTSVEKMRAEAISYLEANTVDLGGPGGSFVVPAGGGASLTALIAYGRALRSQGLRVSSNRALGSPPSPGAHSSTGYHYKFNDSGAIDVNSHPGESAAEKRRLTPVALDALRRGFGVQWLSSGHFNHLHVDVGKYRAVGNTAAWMADGGMLGARSGAERHDAQTVTGLRTFGEPETGGEAYIPLAAHKRGRSLMVLQSVASQFGYTLSKMGGTSYGAVQYAGATPASTGGTSRPGITVQQTITSPEPAAAGRVSAARLEDALNVLDLGGALL